MENIKEEARKDAEDIWENKLKKEFSEKVSKDLKESLGILGYEFNQFNTNISKLFEDMDKKIDEEFKLKPINKISEPGKFDNQQNDFKAQNINSINKDIDKDDNNFHIFNENNNNNRNNLNHKHQQSFPNINSKSNNKTDEKLFAFTERMAPILKNKNNSFNNNNNNNYNNYNNNSNNNSNYINNNRLNTSKLKTEIEPYAGKQSFLQQSSDFKLNHKLNSFLIPHNYSMNDSNLMNRTLNKRSPNMLTTFLTTSNVNSNDGSISYKKQPISPPKFNDNNSELKLFLSAQKKKPKSKIGDLIDIASIQNVFNNPAKKKKKGK